MPDPKRELSRLLKGLTFGRRLLYYPEIDSTNRLGRDLAGSDQGRADLHGTVILADFQTHGRGRMDRTWSSPPGVNLIFSLVLKTGLQPRDSFRATMAGSISMARAIEEVCGLKPLIKWPNDLYLEDRKLAGVLTELAGPELAWTVIGIGLNVGAHPPGVGAIHLDQVLGEKVDRLFVFYAFLNDYQKIHDSGWDREAVRRAWKERSYTLGRQVTVKDGESTVSGRAVDIDRDGALILETESGARRIVCGDVITR